MAAAFQLYTVSETDFFPGTVALLNSLHVTGFPGRATVLDIGLTADQRARLGPVADVVSLPAATGRPPLLVKPFAHLLGPAATVVVADGDVLVTAPLDELLDEARSGRICVTVDHPSTASRRFDEWSDVLGLRAPLRADQPYVNSGFVVFSVERWRTLLGRWWETCSRVPADAVGAGDGSGPFWAGDQDALNALLMSEVPAGALRVLDEEAALFDTLRGVRVLDEATLACRRNGAGISILHYSLGPKPWHGRGWLRVRRDAYVRLLQRLLFAADVPLRLDPREVPIWLRPGAGGAGALRAVHAAHDLGRAAAPRRVRDGVAALRSRRRAS